MVEPQHLVAGITNVSGSAGVFAATGLLGIYRPWTVIPDGTTVPYHRYDAEGNFEAGDAVVNQSGGVATLTRTNFRASSTGSPITWPPGGTQNLVCDDIPMLRQNNLADLDDPDAARAAIGAMSRLATGQTGGSNSTVVRASGAGAVTAASNTDAPADLWPLWWRGPDGLLYRSGQEVPGTFTSGATYYLGTAGAITTTAPTPSTTVTVIEVGYATSSSTLDFRPPAPPAIPRLVVPAWTGGSNSTVVRYAGSSTVVAADNDDSAELLCKLFVRGSDGLIYKPGDIVPWSSTTDGQLYWLGNAGALRTTAGIAGDAFNTIVLVGFGLPGNFLWFNPQPPVGAVGASPTGTPVAIQMESGTFRA